MRKVLIIWTIMLVSLPSIAQRNASGYLGAFNSVGFGLNARPQFYPSNVQDFISGNAKSSWLLRPQLYYQRVVTDKLVLRGHVFWESMRYTPKNVDGSIDNLLVVGVEGDLKMTGTGFGLNAMFFIPEVGSIAPLEWYVSSGLSYIDYRISKNDLRFLLKNGDEPKSSSSMPHLFPELTVDLSLGYQRVINDNIIVNAEIPVRFPVVWATENSVLDAQVESSWVKSNRERIALANAFHGKFSIGFLF